MPTPPPDPPDTPDVPTAPATLSPADMASILVGQAILTGAAPPQVYAGIIRELTQLRGRVAELEAGIRWVVTQEADDLCWMDVYTCLSRLVGATFDPLLIPPEDMKANCHRFVDALHAGCPYGADRLTAELIRLRERVAEQEARGRVLHGRMALPAIDSRAGHSRA